MHWLPPAQYLVSVCMLVCLSVYLFVCQRDNSWTVMPNTHRRRRRDETVLSRRVGVGGVYMNSQLAHDLPTDSVDNLETGQTDCVCVCFCVSTTWILIDTDNFFNSGDIMTSLFKK